MKFFGIVLPVCSLMVLCPLMAQMNTDGTPTSSLPEVDSSAARPLAAAADYLASPLKSNGKSDGKSEWKNDGQTLYRWSLAAVAAGNTADTFSSWHQPESNPLLATPGSEFDARSVALKSAFVGASFLIERWALHQNPRLYHTFAWLNFTIAGVLGGVVAHNVMLN